jgi:hypothetical protein
MCGEIWSMKLDQFCWQVIQMDISPKLKKEAEGVWVLLGCYLKSKDIQELVKE